MAWLLVEQLWTLLQASQSAILWKTGAEFDFFPNMQSCNLQHFSSCSASSRTRLCSNIVGWIGGGLNSYSHPSRWESYRDDLALTFGSSAAASVSFKSFCITFRVGLGWVLVGQHCKLSCSSGEVFRFVSDFCIIFHSRASPWSPQIRVGSVGTMEGWPRVQASSSQDEVKVLEQRAGSFYCHRNMMNEIAVSWCKIAEFSCCHLQLGTERQRKW